MTVSGGESLGLGLGVYILRSIYSQGSIFLFSVNAAPGDEQDGSSATGTQERNILIFRYRHRLELLTAASVLTQWNYYKKWYLGNFNRKDYNFKICMKFIMH